MIYQRLIEAVFIQEDMFRTIVYRKQISEVTHQVTGQVTGRVKEQVVYINRKLPTLLTEKYPPKKKN
ncbi:MAG: hypothetical protein U9R42_01980 [Bacteroidota bacterium]|nr:hypothetical protein [Bacteroidota bacterium]